MTQVVRTVLQEERRDEGVPRPKARQVFTFDLSENNRKAVFLFGNWPKKYVFIPFFVQVVKELVTQGGPKSLYRCFFLQSHLDVGQIEGIFQFVLNQLHWHCFSCSSCLRDLR